MATIILLSIFCFSYILAFIWSYLIVHTPLFKNRMLYKGPISVTLFVQRNALAFKNFLFVLALTYFSLLLIGDAFFSFEKPSILYFTLNFLMFVVIDDIWFYGIHRTMHANKWLYKNIHLVHHKAQPPIPMDFLFTQPVEALTSTCGLVIGIIISILLNGEISIYVFAAYSFYRTLHELALHSGLTVLPLKWLNIVGSSEHHFKHHKFFNGNYASAFTYLDKVFGTEIKETKNPKFKKQTENQNNSSNILKA
jgi:sterol desaturase/sphingolipid hydroxylase (fatty acid hydroxylase superfamily)